VNRLREVSFDMLRQPIGDTSLYYGGQTAGAYLERVFPESDGSDLDYSSGRLDTEHTVYRPQKCFGFLTVVPRAGYRGTYYSDTRQETTFTEAVASSVTNFVVGAGGVTNAVVATTTETRTFTRQENAGSDFRNLFELGLETSYKAFKSWNTRAGERRHIGEPYANYTLVPKPNLTPDNLYEFDEIDTLDEEHFIRFGMRNKYQKKLKDSPFDLVDLDLYTRYLIEREEDQDAIDRAFMDAEFRTSERLVFYTDAEYDIQFSEVDVFNARSTWLFADYWAGTVEYRFKNGDEPEEATVVDETTSLIRYAVDWYACRAWTLGLDGRYEFELDRLEEQGGYIQRNYDCMSVRLGGSTMPGYTRTDGTERDDELRVYMELWFTAFPETTFSGKHRN
jgi:hypothetical protein